ncbi:P-loop containing nucleoside triphosphate hydrolase protein [Mycena metata]|uniref:P-loop containing nucleoside triphosphate hydrolase protein n=1 Tax=Mycena metata TaxID=1033252 RepID=A0AAD7N6K7_9AGAR|nr:P-loop containing nucleoside triphosphate hydrolase protein [Mycena metata]
MGKTVECGIVQKDRMRGCEWNTAATRACAEPQGGIARTTIVRYVPSSNTKQRLRWRGHWMQVEFVIGYEDGNGRTTGGSINILLHSCDKAVLGQFIEAARVHYTNASISRVTVHLTDNYGSWVRAVTKNRRAFSTLILPGGIKELILADARDFLASEEWYTFTGVPHRRGYLLYGEPGTGKSSTIHALAGELGLNIYFISLAAPGSDDYTLGRLIRDTPSRCILLIEARLDIDCAFPSREEDDDEPLLNSTGSLIPKEPIPPRSQVTFAGLLNVLDSVASEEELNLFEVLIRPGRMDLKVRFVINGKIHKPDEFHRSNAASLPASSWNKCSTASTLSTKTARLSAPQLATLAKEFAAAIPAGRYSIAQLHGYLPSSKNDPEGALEGIKALMGTQEKERRDMEELKQKRRKEAALRRAAEAAAESEVAEAVRCGNGGGENGYQNGRANGKTDGHVEKAVSEEEEESDSRQ